MRGKGAAARFNKCMRNSRSVAVAFRKFTGRDTQDMAKALGISRQSVEQCLGAAKGRRYLHVRRALEAEYGLPANHLDRYLP